jgi:hypothetical protein
MSILLWFGSFKIKRPALGWGCRSVVEYLPSMLKNLGSIFTTAKRREKNVDIKTKRQK